MLRIIWRLILLFSPLCLYAQEVVRIEISLSENRMVENDILKHIEYVPLETTSDCLIKSGFNVHVTNEHIIVTDFFYKALLFDRRTGRFIHEIGRAGQGPGEYTGFWAADGFNEKEQLLYMHEWHQWKTYDIRTGKLKQIIKSPGGKYVIQNPYLYKPGIYLGYANNTTGKVPYKLIAFDKEGKISKIYPQYNQIELNLAKDEFPMNAGIFYEFDSNIYFQEVTTDSVFQVTDEVLVPHICFKHPKEISSPGILGETARFVISRYYVKGHTHIAIYDKTEKTTYVDFVFEKSSDQALFEKAVSYRMSQNGELIFLLQPTDIIEYLEAHPEKEEELDKRLVHLMEDDNPIVMVLKIRDM